MLWANLYPDYREWYSYPQSGMEKAEAEYKKYKQKTLSSVEKDTK